MSKTAKILAALVVLIVLVVGAGLYWFLKDDAPDAVSLDAATSGLTDDPDGPSADVEATVDDVAGTWTVDTESGDFDYESATGTFAGFRVEENLSRIGSTTAVGRTGDVTGTLEIDEATVTAATFEVDMASITTNDSRRDDKVAQALEPDRYPTAVFTLTDPIDLGADATNGEPLTVSANGELTIHGVTRPATIDLEAQLIGDTIVVIGSTSVTFSDFDVEVPESPIVLSVDDVGTLELQLLLVRN